MEGGTRLSIQIERNPQAYVRLHPDYRTQVVEPKETTTVYRLGPKFGKVQVVFDSNINTDTMVISSQFSYELGIRYFVKDLHVTIGSREIHFGDVVGILCTPRWNEKEHTLRKTKQLPVLEKLMEIAAQQNVLCFVFHIRDVDLGRWQVKGYRYHQGRWVSDKFPLPNAIYDQVISRKQERRPVNQKARDAILALYDDNMFNPGFLDKWQVYQWLQEDKRMAGFIPATSRYTSVGDAVKFLSQHSVTYCKPVHGSLGLGIFKIERLPEGGYSYQIRKRIGAPISGTATSPTEVINKLKKRLNSKPYLLQQGIALVQLEGRPFDIRIVMQRDGHGEWKRTKMFARVAERGQITSNLSTGGEAASLTDILEPLFSTAVQRRRVIQSVRRVSRVVPEVVEAQSKRQFGELGIDIGVDNQGGVWIIEVNSKPWKTTSTEKGRKDLVDLAFERPIQYAKYLANRSQ